MFTLPGKIRRQIGEAVPTWIYRDDAGSGCPALCHKEAETRSQVSHALSSIKNNLMLKKKKYNLRHSPCLLIFIANLWTRYYSVIKRGNSGSRVAEHIIARTGPRLRDDLYCLSLTSCLWRTAPVPLLRRGWRATLSVYRKRDLLYKKFMETWGDLGVSVEAVDLWSLLSLHPSPHLYWILLFSGSSLT